MPPAHLMERIAETYEKEIRRAAKQYAPRGTDWEDMRQEILLAVYDRVRRRKVGLRDYKALKNTINQRAIDISRKALLHRWRFVSAEKIAETARSSDSPTSVLEGMRIAELKTRLKRNLPILDARIVIELAFPSSNVPVLTRRRPARKGMRRKKGSVGWALPQVWHVARLFNVSKARVAEALEKARKIIGDVIEDEKGGAELISVFVGGAWQAAEVVDDNPKTLWVTLPDSHIIKRHKIKHRMTKYIAPKPAVEERPEKISWWRHFWNWLKGGA